jgi:hypothetical protein
MCINSLSCLFPHRSSPLAGYQEKIDSLKRSIPVKSEGRASVLISGASITGLMRAIISCLNGNPTKVIERRSEGAARRDNAVSLDDEGTEFLKDYAIYDYLIGNGLVSVDKPGCFVVRIGDLEMAMKAVLKAISPETQIQYDSWITKIVERVDQTAQIVISGKNGKVVMAAPNLLVNAEGARSSTNDLLGITRIQNLPKLPVVAAVFKDRPCSLSSIPYGIYDTFVHLYYTLLFLFKMLFGGEHIFNSNRAIRGAIILPTPGQNYVGFTLDKERSNRLSELSSKSHDPKMKAELDAELRYWSRLSFCFANALVIFLYVVGGNPKKLSAALWKPLDMEKTVVIEIGADKASRCSGMVGETAYLIAGDALHTVDPTTGKGASTAIYSSRYFKEILENGNSQDAIRESLARYDDASETDIYRIYWLSKSQREKYRPDAV